MIKGVFISQWGRNKKGRNVGNIRKVEAQINCFREQKYDMKVVITEPYDFTKLPWLCRRIVSKLLNAGPFLSCNRMIRYQEVGKADFYYIRFRSYDYYFRKLLRDIRKKNPSSIILIEYSDYPYLFLRWREILGDLSIYLKNKLGIKTAQKTVNRIVTLLNDSIIDGIKTIKIYNGIDVKSEPVRIWEKATEIRLISVASYQEAHGIDRLIEGLIQYYASKTENKRKIVVHIVGDGLPIIKWRQLSEPIKDKIIFHGALFERELDRIYQTADIGIEILAPQRRKIQISSSLKSREYISRGIPFITACILDFSTDIDNTIPFILKIDSSEKPVDINKIVEFYDKFYGEESRVADKISKMRKFAEEHLSMEHAMKNVINFINQNVTEIKVCSDNEKYN